MRNIQILCFINKDKIKKLKDIIFDKLKETNKLKNAISYLKKYLFKLNESSYNYEDFLNYKGNNNFEIMTKIYFTNNIIENINYKINYYLPKKIINNVDFVNSISKIIINSKFNKNEVIRKEYYSFYYFYY